MWHPPSGGLGQGSGGDGESASTHGGLSQRLSLTTAGRRTAFAVTEGLTACHPRSARRLSGLYPLCFERGSEGHTGSGRGGGKGAVFFFCGGRSAACVMCVHVEVKASKRLKEPRLLQKVIHKAEMALMSNCLKCVRKGRRSRYVTAATSLRLPAQSQFPVLKVSYLWARRLREQCGSPTRTPQVRRGLMCSDRAF